MKKYVLIGILVICGVGSLSYYFLMNKEQTTAKTEVSQSEEQTIDTAIASNDDNTSKSSDSQTKKESQETEDDEANQLVKEYATKFTTFRTIYERNQAIKPLVTEKFAEDNTLDVDPHVEYHSVGVIESISKDISDNSMYVVVGTEESKGYSNAFCLQIRLNDDRTKIIYDDMQYVRGY